MSAPQQPPLPQQPQLRPADEVQRAHDMLVNILLDREMSAKLSDTLADSLNFMAGVLCWVLGHDHNPAFAATLEVLEGWLLREGIVMVDGGSLRYPGAS